MLNRQKFVQFFNSWPCFFPVNFLLFFWNFQFLMVRLKVQSFWNIKYVNFISIPSGSIIMIQRYKTFLEIPNFLHTILYVFLLIYINSVYKQLIVNMLVYVIFFAFYITVFTVFLNSFFIVVKLVKFLFLYVSKMSHMLWKLWKCL